MKGRKINGVLRELDEALFAACRQNDAPKVRQLLRAGADVEATDKNGYTPLMVACIRGSDQAAIAMVGACANIFHRDNTGYTPLHHAATFANPAIVGALIAAGADVNAKTDAGITPLHSVSSGATRVPDGLLVVDALIRAGANVDAEHHRGWTPLHYAAACGRILIAEKLVQAGADVNAMTKGGSDGSVACLPERIAEMHDYSDVATYLRNVRLSSEMRESLLARAEADQGVQVGSI